MRIEGGRFELGCNLDGTDGFVMLAKSEGKKAKIAAGKPLDNGWHHLAVTYAVTGGYVFYVDGKKSATRPGRCRWVRRSSLARSAGRSMRT